MSSIVFHLDQDRFILHYFTLQVMHDRVQSRKKSSRQDEEERNANASGGNELGGALCSARCRLQRRARGGTGQNLRAQAITLGAPLPSVAKGARGLGRFGREGIRRQPQ